MTWRWLICFSAIVASSNAAAISGAIELRDSRLAAVSRQKDFSGVVISAKAVNGAPSSPPGAHAVMLQKGKMFTPHVLPVATGTIVDFPNADPIFHNAFSSYDGQIFDVGLYPPGTSRSVAFRREGTVRIFCNIHPAMSAVIVVVKSPYFTVSEKNGEFTIPNIPSGSYRLRVFHERATQQTLDALTRTVEVSSDLEAGRIAVSESGYLLLPHKNKYGKDYPPSEGGTYSGVKP